MLLGLRHSFVRQPDDGEGGQAGRHLHLHAHGTGLDSLKGDCCDPLNHTTIPAASKVVTKTALRAADRLEIKNNVLAKIIGLSAPTISRMYKGAYLVPSESKAFELAVLFVRFYRALDGIVGGDDSVAADWLKNKNTVLNGIPLEMIQSVSGLTNAIEYLDSRRAIV